jgi:hypothetical protein
MLASTQLGLMDMIYIAIKKEQLIMRSSSLYQHTAWPDQDGHEVAINYKEQLGQCAA